MIEHIIPLSMVVCLLLGIFSGYPVAFVLGGIGIALAFIGGLPFAFLKIGVSRIYAGVIENWLLLSVPLFVFMGAMLDKSGLAQNLLYSLERALGRRRGGLAISVALLGIVMAASTGIVGTSVVMLSTLALPIMLREKYKPELAVGTIAASGTLGILIPPSIVMVVYASATDVSVGRMFLAGVIPGLLAGTMLMITIYVIARIRDLPKGDWKGWAEAADAIVQLDWCVGQLMETLDRRPDARRTNSESCESPGFLVGGV